MTTLEEVKSMQSQGVAEEQIVQTLREKGRSYREIADALSQSRIKAAVEDPSPDSQYPQQTTQYPETPTPAQYPETQNNQQDSNQQFINSNIPQYPQNQMRTHYPENQQESGMQPSIMNQAYENQQIEAPIPQQEQFIPTPSNQNQQFQYPENQPYPQYDQSAQNQQYSQYTQSISPDIITEIATQAVTEKFSDIKKHLEKVIDFKTTIDSKVESIDDRLKRIEKLIDTLQSSVLRKVGDYVTNVQDLKSELVETQKTFAKLLPERKSLSNSHSHSSNQNHKTHKHHKNTSQHTQNQHHESKK